MDSSALSSIVKGLVGLYCGLCVYKFCISYHCSELSLGKKEVKFWVS